MINYTALAQVIFRHFIEEIETDGLFVNVPIAHANALLTSEIHDLCRDTRQIAKIIYTANNLDVRRIGA